ncbi:hypothetical protein VTK73DRAFT_9896 [Phialemonium thermophilum]|uniref:Aminopeptidase n=1 Tax=Phialemonium thermophilum TaxID=223376 RepID=A0ABR3VZH9_9PEZI
MGSLPIEPRGVKPINYRLSVFDIQFEPEWQFRGSVTIEAQVHRSTSEVVLHAASLEILRAEFSQGPSPENTELCTDVETLAKGSETVRFSLPRPLEPGLVSIQIEYRAPIGNSMSGFFRARFRDVGPSAPGRIRDGDYAAVLSTHFEPCYARSAFPCFDEPHLKATFDFDIEVPADLTALSNMPVKASTALAGSKAGQKRIQFQRTPVMSTYLLAWVVGEFEYVEAFTEKKHGGIHVPVRVYTPLGLRAYATLAVECAWKVLDLYRDMFQIDYPIHKCDHVIVPEFVSGAMENWGLITYKPTKILFDPATCNHRVKAKAVYVIAHELAHQWFGNLVTMADWSELWLNEGFATWAGFTAANRLFPEWNIWGQYVSEILDDVMKLDSLPTTHPIMVDVQDENDALQMFDQISYNKGSSVISMLASYIGEDVFLRGLSAYLQKYAYRNARSQDLWEALSCASGTDVAELMDSWIYTGSFPVVRLSRSPGHERQVEQQSILSADTSGAGTQSTWDIPLKDAPPEDRTLSTLNRNHVGYYCTDYDPDTVASIVQSMSSLTSADLAGVIVDMGNLTTNNLKPTSELLNFLWDIRGTRDCFAWLAISRSLAYLRSVFADDQDVRSGLQSFSAALVDHVHDKLQWTADAAEYTQAELNKVIIGLAFSAGSGSTSSAAIIQESRRHFARWVASSDDERATVLPPTLRSAILSGCMADASPSDFEVARRAFVTDATLDGQEVILTAMGAVESREVAEQVLDFVFAGDVVALQHLPVLGGALGHNTANRTTQWEYVRSHWAAVSRRLHANSVCRDWWIEESLRHFSDVALGQEMGGFLIERLGAVVRKPLRNVQANILRNATYKERSREDILHWLRARGYITA